MMRGVRLCCGIALACVWASGWACDLPKLVMIPPADQMSGHEKQISGEVSAYYKAMHKYVGCIKAELVKDGGDNAPPLVKALLVQRNNVAVAEASAVIKWYKKTAGSQAKNDEVGKKKH